MDKKTILVVEDDMALNKALSDFLSAEGFDVVVASDGEEGLRRAVEMEPDLVLLDIIMPKKDGFEVIKEMKADEKLKSIPIILLTNLGSINDVEKAIELGATTYLVKADYSLEEVTQKVKTVLKIS